MGYRLGIDFGGTDIKAGVVNENFEIICKGSVPTRPDHDFEKVVADMARLAYDVADKAGIPFDEITCIGIGTPSYVHPVTKRLVFSNNTGWVNVPLFDELRKHIPRPISVGNDANCAIIGEAIAGAAKKYDNVVLLTLGTGVGGGVILNRKLFAGADSMGAELGHTPFRIGGEACTCGMYGCFEAYASVSALIRQTKAAMAEHPESLMIEYTEAKNGRVTGRTAFDCARQGDETAQQVVDTYIDYVAHGIGGFINIFRPDIVLIGGGISNEGEYLLRPINEKLPAYVLSYKHIGAPPVIAATLGNDAGIIGAAYWSDME